MSTDELREVGRIGRAHGVRGQVHVQLITDRSERLASGAQVRAGSGWLTVVESRPQRDDWLVKFEGIDDRTAAERLTNTVIFAAPLPDQGDELWVHQLVGSRVIDLDGIERGTCVSVIDNPAHDLLELDNGSLVPVTFVVSCENGITTVDPPEGLFDL